MKSEGQTKQIKNFIYNTADQIGKGFSSAVYKGTNLTNKSLVAIKVIDLKSIKTEVEKKLLGNEMKALKMLNHENLIQSYDIYQTSNNVYLVSELCSAGDLCTYYTKHALSDTQILKILKEIALGVQHFASKGIIHRDLKPANILINNGVVKIIDFGFCEFKAEKQETKMKYNVGSPLYMSPQAYRNSNYSEKSDVWAIGVILYEMIIKKTPFKGIDYDTMVKNVVSGQIYKDVESGFFKMLLSRMLSIDVNRRSDINEVIALLAQQGSNATVNILRKPSDIKAKKKFVFEQIPISAFADIPQKIKTFAFYLKSTTTPTSTSLKERQSNRPTTYQHRQNIFKKTLIPRLIICKISRNQSTKSTIIQRIHHLTLLQLKFIIHYIENSQSLFVPDMIKISNFTKESIQNFNISTYLNDLYFTHICTNTSNWLCQTVSDYILFWLKVILSQLYQQFNRLQSHDSIQTQKFQLYLYCSQYYKLVGLVRGKKIAEIDKLDELAHLLSEKKIMNREAIESVNKFVKTILQTR